MARLARVVASGLPHHVTQRGNRRQPVFFCDDDYRAYAQLRGHLWQGGPATPRGSFIYPVVWLSWFEADCQNARLNEAK